MFWILSALLIIFAVLIILFRDLLYAAISLALASIMVSLLLFRYNANLAAVFELSVCAGLVTVLFIAAISLTKDSDRKSESKLPLYFFPLFFILIAGSDFFILSWLREKMMNSGQIPGAEQASFGEFFWGHRGTDIWGQAAVLLAGVFGMLAVFRIRAGKNSHNEKGSADGK
jgi:NADH:ubiquinone oxidoreductase subunit 6 (subunit J)